MTRRAGLYAVLIVLLVSTTSLAAGLTDSLVPGKVDLKSAGVLAFGPEGVLFVGDAMSSAIYALDTGDRTPANAVPDIDITDIEKKIAAMLGSSPDQISIRDLAVNPVSRNIYISLSRGRSLTGIPVIMRIETNGKIDELSLENIKHSKIILDSTATIRYRSGWHLDAITDLAFVDNRVFVAGLSNQEFSSRLRSIPFPFSARAESGTSVEIFHSSHGRFETNSPVRTFVPYRGRKEQYILAAYTCTPLVKLPLSSLKAGARVKGTTIAEFGGGNRPLDMIVYSKGGKDYMLMSNTARALVKLGLDDIEDFTPITPETIQPDAVADYEYVEGPKNVQKLELFDDTRALILTRAFSGSLDLKTIALP